ncbi:MFS general substrate transporter [Hypoxylon sp. FL1284]|nr:MFS general substrate transporter [Hypoxylon sp. FL1284]
MKPIHVANEALPDVNKRRGEHPALDSDASEKTLPAKTCTLAAHSSTPNVDFSASEAEMPETNAKEEMTDEVQELDANAPIAHLYLTFETPVDCPELRDSRLEGPDLPRPDLSRYADPLTWPKARKDIMVAISCIATASTAYSAGAYSEAADVIAADLRASREGALAGVTTFCVGFAVAPMVLAPFSEINGRYPIFAVAGIVFTVFQAVCGVVTNLAGMLVARFLKGVGGSVFSTMVGGVIADMYGKDERNTPMALFSGSVLIGTGLGPLVAAVMVESWGSEGEKWKWVFWHQVIANFVLMVVVMAFFKESRGCVVLSRKAKALNVWYERLEERGLFGIWVSETNGNVVLAIDPVPTANNAIAGAMAKARCTPWSERDSGISGSMRLRRVRWIVREDEQRASIATMITVSLFRPFVFLFTEPIVFFFSLWVSFAWAILYLTFESIPLVFQRQYGFDAEQSGYVFIAMILGSIIATVIGIYQESVLRHPSWRADPGSSEAEPENDGEGVVEKDGFWAFVRRRFPAESPESRLYFTCFTSVLLPAGLYLFGFAAQPSVHWMVPSFAIFLATMGIFYIYLATFNYLADSYQTYASSALAAQSFCRNVLGGAFPLVTGPLIRNLGEDAMGGLLGGIATALTIVPWVLVFFGRSIRGRSAFATVSISPCNG